MGKFFTVTCILIFGESLSQIWRRSSVVRERDLVETRLRKVNFRKEKRKGQVARIFVEEERRLKLGGLGVGFL